MRRVLHLLILISLSTIAYGQGGRSTVNFDQNWAFYLGDVADGQSPGFDDAGWRKLDLPHDWSIEGEFKAENPATVEGGALPGGIGWYRKTFFVPVINSSKLTYIAFDGVYQKAMYG